MKKIILVALLLITVSSLVIGFLKYKEYNDEPKAKDNSEEVEKQIKEVEVEIEKVKEKYQEKKKKKKEELEVIESWQERIKTIRDYI